MKRTFGEKRVRTESNPTSFDHTDIIKQKSAELIDFLQNNLIYENTEGAANSFELEEIKNRNSEKKRLIALAQTAYEEAAMWAVKAATC